MIGLFLLNDEGKLCYVRPAHKDKPEITSFRYVKKTHKVYVTVASGQEEEITSEIVPGLREAFAREKTILVADIDKDKKPEWEYRVPLTA